MLITVCISRLLAAETAALGHVGNRTSYSVVGTGVWLWNGGQKSGRWTSEEKGGGEEQTEDDDGTRELDGTNPILHALHIGLGIVVILLVMIDMGFNVA